MLIHVKEKILRVIFQPSFSRFQYWAFRGRVIGSYILRYLRLITYNGTAFVVIHLVVHF